MAVTTPRPFVTGQDISSLEFRRLPFEKRDETFAWLRKNAPVSWQPPMEIEGVPAVEHVSRGFWAVTKAEDIREASLDHETFSSAQGSIFFRPPSTEVPPAPTFLELDPPEHTRYRRLLSAAFTPKAVARLTQQIEDRAASIVGGLVGVGDFDLVTDLAARLPMLTVADMVGVPESLVQDFADAGDNFEAAYDDDVRPPHMTPAEFEMEQIEILCQIGLDLVSHRRTNPADDVASALATAEFDGKPLTDEEITSVMLLLSIAGNDTTKQTTTWTAYNLHHNPDQREWLRNDFDGRIRGAVEEFVRHASPVITFLRTATRDVQLGGQLIRAGDRVGLFYCSGNRDESVFDDPHAFDLARPIGHHVGFGGGGVHYCLGNNVAKVQLRSLFREVFDKLPDLEIAGEPDLLFSELINGVKHLPARSGGGAS